MLDITQTNIDQLLDLTRGATVINEGELQHTSLLAFAQPLLAGFKVPPDGSLISNYSFTCLSDRPHQCWEDFATILARELNDKITPYLPIEPINFDDLYLTFYPPSQMGVGCHRDTNCKGLVLAYVLEGTLPFYICEDKAMNNSQLLTVKPGEILLMRGRNLGELPQPFHFVGPVEKSVLQFGLRQYIDPNK